MLPRPPSRLERGHPSPYLTPLALRLPLFQTHNLQPAIACLTTSSSVVPPAHSIIAQYCTYGSETRPCRQGNDTGRHIAVPSLCKYRPHTETACSCSQMLQHTAQPYLETARTKKQQHSVEHKPPPRYLEIGTVSLPASRHRSIFSPLRRNWVSQLHFHFSHHSGARKQHKAVSKCQSYRTYIHL